MALLRLPFGAVHHASVRRSGPLSKQRSPHEHYIRAETISLDSPFADTPLSSSQDSFRTQHRVVTAHWTVPLPVHWKQVCKCERKRLAPTRPSQLRGRTTPS